MAVPIRSRRSLLLGAATALAGGVLLGLSLALGLNGDVQYFIGVQEVRGGGIDGALGTFAHRPVVYRVVLGAIDEAMRLIGLRPSSQVPYEAAVRLLAVAVAVVAAWLLFRGLRGRLGPLAEAWTAIAVGLALAFAPNWDFLQSEWVATLFGVMAIGVALSLRYIAVAGGLSGALLVAAIAAKIATAPIALLALLLISMLDLRRAAAAAVGAAAWSLLAITLLAFLPLEQRWLADMIALSPSSVVRSGIGADQLLGVLRSTASQAALSPAVLLLPAAAVILGRNMTVASSGARWFSAVAIAALLAVGPMLLQGEIYLYLVAALSVLAAGICGFAAGRWADAGDLPIAFPITLAVAALAGTGLMLSPDDWRQASLGVIVALVLGAAAMLAVVAARFVRMPSPASPQRGRPPRRRMFELLLATSVAVLPVVLPATAWSLDPGVTPRTNASWEAESRSDQEALRGLSERIGRDEPVLYMTYGTVAYHMGNPTPCRYPSPVWLRRTDLEHVRGFFSYADNEACLRSSEPEYLIIDPAWLPLGSLLPDDLAVIDRSYDCGSAMPQESRILACPRRR